MELRSTCTGGIFSCDDEMGNRLLAEGGYEKVGAPKRHEAAAVPPAPVEDAPAAPVKRSPRKAAGAH